MPKETSAEANTKRETCAAFVLLFFALSWFTLTVSYVRSLGTSDPQYSFVNPLIRAVYYVSIVVSSIAGSVISKRFRRLPFLVAWMVGGALLSFFPVLFTNIVGWQSFALSIFLGFAFGVGMPAALALFAELVHIESRGTVSGAIFMSSNLGIAVLAVALASMGSRDVILVAGIWRAVGAALFFLLRPRGRTSRQNRKSASFSSVFRHRQFLLYFIPWLAFCLIDFFENPIRASLFRDVAPLADVLGVAIGSFSAIIGGVFSDRIGRKIVVLYGFVSIGIAYAVLTLAPHNAIILYFYSIVNGVAWGILTSIFILTLWGDLSQPGEREKYYAVGSMPFFLAAIIELAVQPYVSFIHAEAAFSLAAFFLFLGVLPLLYAPETLPEKRIKERELKGYLDKAKKIKEKYV